ncbi:MAG: hypothetical protein MZV49_12035 [Rhodopseudomonas palustris]|nr:hypothetical protein [Rhodopseudomonas palustris]
MLRGRRAVRPHRGHRAGAGSQPCGAAARSTKRCAARRKARAEAILFNLCGHGHFDMQAYMDYFAGKLTDQDYDEAELAASLAALPEVAA